ncbi:MAG TPA: hypothetical protein VM597_10460 [Gemmataceae bacterium]|jgi:hypothetical protein|nr:hypothetical protein [Gemmataceae bacterium]
MASIAPVLGVMKFEADPVSFDDTLRLARMGFGWIQDAGGFAMIGLLLWILNGLLYPVYEVRPNGKKYNRLVGPGMLFAAALGLTAYLVSFGVFMAGGGEVTDRNRVIFLGVPLTKMDLVFEIVLAVAGLIALVGFVGPFLMDLFKLRWRRIYALAKLSFKEAVRRRVVWVFLGILILYLFPARWFFAEKPEDELKSIIGVTTRGMNVLLISVGLLLAAFSIPNDIKTLTIHTIVTKPVERFEIILGRLLGYLGLLTLALLVMTGFGLLLINLGNVSEEAAYESFKARVARYGTLQFGKYDNRRQLNRDDGTDVGREDSYRRYVAGGQRSPQRAIWTFESLPAAFQSAEGDVVPLEFAFDIYRTTKGEEGAGVSVSFELLTHKWDPTQLVADPDAPGAQITVDQLFLRQSQGLKNPRPGTPEWAKVNELAEKYGRYVFTGKQIFDYHTTSIPVPTGLFKSAAQAKQNPDAKSADPTRAALRVEVKCDTPSQFVGVAKYDLYFLESEGNFSLNYFKGAAGLWFRMVIAITLAVCLSTYLAGVLSFLVAMGLFIGGFFLEFIQDVSRKMNIGGGPLESLTRLINNSVATAELDQTPTIRTLQMFDGLFRWVLRRVMNVIPNVDQYGMSEYVSEGFSIGPGFLLVNLLMLLAYLLPWLVAAYYLMKAREVAA